MSSSGAASDSGAPNGSGAVSDSGGGAVSGGGASSDSDGGATATAAGGGGSAAAVERGEGGGASLADLGIRALADGYRTGRFTPPDVLDAVLARSARWEPHIRATWAPDEAGARRAADASAARWKRGAPLSPLDGVPATVKDNIATRGVPVPLGCAATDLAPAPDDAPPAARLREAGALLFAKTTMPDLGMLSSGRSSFHALTRNPWDLATNPGGSSAGAGAAAAAGYGPLHLGTDIGGSIRLPAAWCGVVGFKPSQGRVPVAPPYVGRVAGPLARTVADVAAAMAVLSRPDWRDATSLPPAALDWEGAVADADPAAVLRGLRVGLWLDAGWGMAVEPRVADAVVALARRVERAGAVVEPLAPFATPAMVDGIDAFWRLRAYLALAALAPAQRAQVLPFILEWVAPAAGYGAAQAFDGYSRIGELRDATVAATRGFDFVLSPVAPLASFAADAAMPSGDAARAMAHIGFTLAFNMSGQPALSLPCTPPPAQGAAAPVPLAVQLAGRRHDDLGVLRVARALERLRGPLPRWPMAPDGARAG